MEIFLDVSIFAIALAILLKSADYFVIGSVGIAERYRIPKMVIGIVLMGFVTTAPEFAVSVQASYLGYPEIALGNAVGSVICDDALVLAVAALLCVIPIDRKVVRITGIFLFSVASLSFLLALDGTVERVEGFILIFLLVGYLLFILRRSRSGGEEVVEERMKKYIVGFFLGGIGIIVASRLIIWSSVSLASHLGVPEIVIALSMIALGTSLPELSTAIVASYRKEGEIAAGNIIGADILNILWIIGVASIVNPIRVEIRTIHFSFPFMLLVVATMLLLMRHKYTLTRWKGILLLSLYSLYLLLLIKYFIV
jgi:cation:H+ antiporter